MTLIDRLSIRGKLILVILAVSLSVLMATALASYIHYRQQGQETLAQQLTTLTQLMGDRSSAALAFLDEYGASDNLAALHSVPYVSQACLYDADRKLFAAYHRAGVTPSCAGRQASWLGSVRISQTSMLAQSVIASNQRTLGVLEIESTLEPIQRDLRAQVLFSLASLSLALILAVSLSLWLQHLISRPIIGIRDVAEEIERQGNFSLRAPYSGSDEISQLAQSFNRMLMKIETQNLQLVQRQNEAFERMRRIEAQQSATSLLAKMPAVLSGDLATVIRKVTQQFGSVLNTARVSVWMYNDDETQLVCQDLYEHARAEHSSGLTMAEADFTNEFRALKLSKYVDASDALSDPRTAGYVNGYLKPLGISSLLDVSIQAGSRHYGVLCFEHVGPARYWHADEISYAMAVADQIAITLQNALRAESDAALRESNAYTKVLFSDSRIPLVVLDPQTGQFLDCNQAAIDIYQLDRAENVLGRTPLDMSAPTQYDGTDSAVAAQGHIARALASDSHVFEWRHQRPNGDIWDAEVHLMRFQAGGRELLQFSLQDITARKRAEAQIHQLNQELEQRVASRTLELAESNGQLQEALTTLQHAQTELVRSEKLASLGSLVAGVAHELNTPLGNSLTVATALADATFDFLDEMKGGQIRRSVLNRYLVQASEASELLSRNLFRASDLITHFKQVAVDQTSAQRRSFDLKENIEEIVLTLQPQFKHTPHRIEVDVPDGIQLDSYPGSLGQVMTNLTLNALIHGLKDQPGGVIRIHAELPGADRVQITVSDNGCGISPQHLPRIFDPFFTTRLGQGGSGLGLHIVYSIVTRAMGGVVDAYSVVGEGTRFVIDIPLRAPLQADKELQT
jgi:PAS domain S-box-containing protein